MSPKNIFRLLIMTLLVVGCSSVNPRFDSAKSHHTVHGFKNNYSVADSPSADDIDYSKQTVNLPKPSIDSVLFDSKWSRENTTENSVTFLGHATALIQLGGLNILTDPHFSERASPVSFLGPKRTRPAAATVSQLPRVDVVVVSHNHYDHLDLPSLKLLLKQPGGEPLIVVPIGNGDLIRELGAKRVQELDWWDHLDFAGSKIYSVPVHHWSARTLWDNDCALWGGWVIESTAGRVFFAGDTAYSPDFKDIAKRFASFDLALIPIGAYAPRSVMRSRHVNPAEAVQIHKDLNAKQSMGIHWGTFELTDEPAEQPLIDLAIARQSGGISSQEFFIPRHGAINLFPKGQR